MSPSIATQSTPESTATTSSLSQLGRLVATLQLALRIYRERRALQALPDYLLKDIGLSRSQIHAEASRGLLDLPDQRPDDRRRRND